MTLWDACGLLNQRNCAFEKGRIRIYNRKLRLLKLHPVIHVFQCQGAIDGVQQNRGIQPVGTGYFPKVVFRVLQVKSLHEGFILRHQDVFPQGGQRAVIVELYRAVVFFGAFGEDFQNEQRVGDGTLFFAVKLRGAANKSSIGIYRLIRCGDKDVYIAVQCNAIFFFV